MSTYSEIRGGFGVLVTEDILDALIQNSVFTREEWERDAESALQRVCRFVPCSVAPLADGDFCLKLNGATIPELAAELPRFLQGMRRFSIYLNPNSVVQHLSIYSY